MPSSRLPNNPHATQFTGVFNISRKNALKRKLNFELTRDEFDALIHKSNGRCMVSGIPFDFTHCGRGKRRPFAASLDRISSAEGYTKKNCRLVCIIVNISMNEWGEEPLLKMCQAIYKGYLQQKLAGRELTNNFMRPVEFLRSVGEKTLSIHTFCAVLRAYCKRTGAEMKVESIKNYQRADLSWAYHDTKTYSNAVLKKCLDVAIRRQKNRLGATFMQRRFGGRFVNGSPEET